MKSLYILVAILVFGVLIAVHEFGHFITAKLCGVKVNEFSIGMGPELWSRKKGETQYSLRVIPVGGYCAMEGEDEDTGDERSLSHQNFWKKLLILSAGSLMNFLTGLLIVLCLYAGAVAFYTDSIVGLAPEVTQTGETGLMVGDEIYKVNGYRSYLYGDTSVFLQYSDDTADIEVLRDGEHIVVADVPRQTCTSQEGTSYRGFGLYVGVKEVPASFSKKLQYSWYQTIDFVQMVRFSLVQLVSGGAKMDDLSGPVGIVNTITEVGEEAEKTGGISAAMESIFYFAALLAVNLAVMNLLPLPALDGGRIFFLLIDAISLLLFKRKVPERYQAVVNTVGFAVLMGFMLLVTFHDVSKLVQ